MKSNASPNPSRKSVRDDYKQSIQQFNRGLADIQRQSAWFSRLRGLTFLGAVAAGVCVWAYPAYSAIAYTGVGVCLLGFLILAGFHERILEDAALLRQRLRMSRLQLNRIDRIWKDIPVREVGIPDEHRAVATDLDLFGSASLFQLSSVAHTPFGEDTLRDWFLKPAPPEEIKSRQESLAAFASDAESREQLDLRGRMLGTSREGPQAFVEWAEGPPWLARRRWLMWLTRVLAVGFLAGVVGWLTGWIAGEIALVVLLAVLAANFVVIALFVTDAIHIFDGLSSRNHDVRHYFPLFELIAGLPSGFTFFDQLKSDMGKTPREPLARLSGLTRILWFANMRRNGLIGILYVALQVVVLIDFHLLALIEIWQRRHGRFVRQWLESVGKLEALSSLATLAHDHPDWTLPNVDPSNQSLNARGIGHPLLGDAACVHNDVEIGPAGTFLLVTGSNMSGKSTLLRSIGVNVTLAQAGGPVCASDFRMPPLRVATSMRISDSLADGVSFFMAELKRMKQIVDQSQTHDDTAGQTLLYLLDEILQGTNSAERHIAVARIVGSLVSAGALGAVSTHDLELARSPDLSTACQPVHFRENFIRQDSKPQMTFDYKLHPGIAPTTNALKLLELVGLGD